MDNEKRQKINERRRQLYKEKKQQLKTINETDDEDNKTISSNGSLNFNDIYQTKEENIQQSNPNNDVEFLKDLEINIKTKPNESIKFSNEINIDDELNKMIFNNKDENDEELNKKVFNNNEEKPKQAIINKVEYSKNEINEVENWINEYQNKNIQQEIKPQKNFKPKLDIYDLQLLGLNKRVLIKKITEYKNLFPDELKTFKIKPNANEEELKRYLDEMDSIVSTSNVDGFISDSILNCVKMIEPITARTENYDISGLADLLKENKEFMKLLKQLYIKYGAFTAIPPEYQLIMIVSTSAYIVRNKNIKKKELNRFLNEPINNNQQ